MRLPFCTALIGLAALAAPASAGIISLSPADVGTSYTVNYDGYADGKVIDGLSGQVTLTLADIVDNSYRFDYQVANTSADPIDASRISVFGFNTDPNILGAASTGLFDIVSTDANVPSGFGTVDVCFKGAGGANSCSGGGGTGVGIGETAGGSLTLNFADALDELTLSDFFVRYQSIDGAGAPSSAIGRGDVVPTGSTGGSTGSTGSTGGSTGSTGSTGGTPVPAPPALLLFAGGLAALGLRFGRARPAPALA